MRLIELMMMLLLPSIAWVRSTSGWTSKVAFTTATGRQPTRHLHRCLKSRLFRRGRRRRLQVHQARRLQPNPISAGKGFVFYGASWCSQCKLQKRKFGRYAGTLPYVECSIDGTRERTEACVSMNIKAYPTWVFPDGSRQSGVYSRERLSSISGCS